MEGGGGGRQMRWGWNGHVIETVERRIKLNQVNPFQTKEIALNLLATILTQTS